MAFRDLKMFNDVGVLYTHRAKKHTHAAYVNNNFVDNFR